MVLLTNHSLISTSIKYLSIWCCSHHHRHIIINKPNDLIYFFYSGFNAKQSLSRGLDDMQNGPNTLPKPYCIFGLCLSKWWWFSFQSSFLPCHCSYIRSTYVTDDYYADIFMPNTWVVSLYAVMDVSNEIHHSYCVDEWHMSRTFTYYWWISRTLLENRFE